MTRGEGGTTVTLGYILLESSAGVATKVGIRSASFFVSRLVLIVAVGGRALTDADGVAAVDWALLRVAGDSNERSELERSRLWDGDAALTSFDRKLGAIDPRMCDGWQNRLPLTAKSTLLLGRREG
jgi:hypothetical protein